ncbi:MmyB family transcriptional regulator [Amycolatopsis nivea]
MGAALGDLIAEFPAQGEGFARWWAQRDVAVNGRGRNLLRHPEAKGADGAVRRASADLLGGVRFAG